MPRFPSIGPASATGETLNLLAQIQGRFGMIPNQAKVLANAPAALRAYVQFRDALDTGVLPATLREQIALAVSEANGCQYGLSEHSALAKTAGMSGGEILETRRGESADEKTRVALHFARRLVEERGWVGDEDVESLRAAGYRDEDVIEIIANVSLSIFANYFNQVAGTDVDFPRVPMVIG